MIKCHMLILFTVYRKQRLSKSGDKAFLAKNVEEADHLRDHQAVKPIYAKRKETIEHIFEDAKEKSMVYVRLL